MKDAKIITQEGTFDLSLNETDIATDETGATLLSTLLFSQEYWGNQDFGSRFEETAGGIITNNTRVDVNAVLTEIKEENSKKNQLKNLSFFLTLSPQNIAVEATWETNSGQKTAVYNTKTSI